MPEARTCLIFDCSLFRFAPQTAQSRSCLVEIIMSFDDGRDHLRSVMFKIESILSYSNLWFSSFAVGNSGKSKMDISGIEWTTGLEFFQISDDLGTSTLPLSSLCRSKTNRRLVLPTLLLLGGIWLGVVHLTDVLLAVSRVCSMRETLLFELEHFPKLMTNLISFIFFCWRKVNR